MFYNCYKLKTFSFDKLNFDDYNYINMSHMFYNCTNLQYIENSNIIQYISDMSYMFYNCISLQSINLTNFIINNNQNIDLSYMFYNCQKLKNITYGDSSFNLKDIKYMFYNCSKLNQINNFNY